jgi:hypothetical protein
MAAPPASTYELPVDAERGYQWVAFAGVLILLIGGLNVIQGIAAIGNSHLYTRDAHYVIGSLHTWGWVVLIGGIVQLLVGAGVFAKNQLARWAGAAILSLNAIVQLLMMPAYPLWGLSLFALAVLALYGLVAHGRRSGTMD